MLKQRLDEFDAASRSIEDLQGQTEAARHSEQDLNERLTQFKLHKQFLNSESARLDREEDGQYVPFAESRAADDRARDILSGEAPGRGASDQRHWGLAQILWAPQGSLQIEQLAPGTKATIQDTLGAQITGPGSETLEKRIAVHKRISPNDWFNLE